MKLLLYKELLKGKILDFACGLAEDYIILKSQEFDIYCYDKFNLRYKNEELLNNIYDYITCLYCFNVIADLKEHNEVLEQLKNLSNNIYIAVRSDSKSIKENWIYNKKYDGYITTTNSFQRFYDEEKINKYFGNVTYIHNGKDFKLFKLHI